MRLADFLSNYQTNGRRAVPRHPVVLQKKIGEMTAEERLCYILFPKGDRSLVVGRGSGVPLTVPGPEVSSRHAQFSPTQSGTPGWSLMDLGSSNGTFVQERRLPPHEATPLSDLDLVSFGPSTVFQYLHPQSFERVLRKASAPDQPPPPPRQTRSADQPPPPPPRARDQTRKHAPAAKPPPAPAREPAPAQTAPAPAEPVDDESESGLSPRQAPPTDLPGDFVAKLLLEARKVEASDLHLTSNLPPVLRINGELQRREGPILSPQDTEALVWQVGTDAERAEFFETNDLDTCATIGNHRYRLNVAKHRSGFALSFRLIQERVPTLEELGIPVVAAELTKYAQGLVLITGPLGSGKTTTMFALVDLVNRTRPENIITIEDPVEFLLPPQKCQVAQRERGIHTASFGAALRGALREDPDIIVIGDLRDHETASLAISAAETGHLVFASMATTNASKTIDKLIDLFPAGEQATTRTMLSESLRGILCQHLLPGTGGKRLPAVELVFNSIAVSNIIREGKSAGLLNAMQLGRAQGMCSLETSLTDLVKEKRITKETADAVRAG